MNSIWNTLNAPTVPFYCVPKITFCAPSGPQNTLIIQYSESNSRVSYFLLEVPNLKIHRDMTRILYFWTF